MACDELTEGVTTVSPVKTVKSMSLAYRPPHVYVTNGIRSVQDGGRFSSRETIWRVAAGAVAKKTLKQYAGTERKENTVARDKHETELIAIEIVMILVLFHELYKSHARIHLESLFP